MSKDASGQVDPKKTNGEKRVKRGRLHFTEEEVTRQAGEQASGQVGPKSQSTGKFRQDGERESRPPACGRRTKAPGRYRL